MVVNKSRIGKGILAGLVLIGLLLPTAFVINDPQEISLEGPEAEQIDDPAPQKDILQLLNSFDGTFIENHSCSVKQPSPPLDVHD